MTKKKFWSFFFPFETENLQEMNNDKSLSDDLPWKFGRGPKVEFYFSLYFFPLSYLFLYPSLLLSNITIYLLNCIIVILVQGFNP